MVMMDPFVEAGTDVVAVYMVGSDYIVVNAYIAFRLDP